MKNVFRSTLLWLISKRYFSPDISPSVYKATQNPLRSCISPGLISGSLRYVVGMGQREKEKIGVLDGNRTLRLLYTGQTL